MPPNMVLLRLQAGMPGKRQTTELWYETYEATKDIADRIYEQVAVKVGGGVAYDAFDHPYGRSERVILDIPMHDINLSIWTRMLFAATGSNVGG